MNDNERELWVLNDESLYVWWRQSRLGMRAFLRTNREELDTLISQALEAS